MRQLLQGLPENFFPNRIIKPRVEPGDIWDASELGVFPHKHSKRGNKLNFSFIQQWLKENVKNLLNIVRQILVLTVLDKR